MKTLLIITLVMFVIAIIAASSERKYADIQSASGRIQAAALEIIESVLGISCTAIILVLSFLMI